jgi:hypothetical protein
MQSLYPDQLDELMSQVRLIASAVGREIATPRELQAFAGRV